MPRVMNQCRFSKRLMYQKVPQQCGYKKKMPAMHDGALDPAMRPLVRHVREALLMTLSVPT